MAQTPPPAVDELPPEPNTGNPVPFAGLMDTFLAALAPFRSGMIALATNCYNNAVDCYSNAQLALASAISASASAAGASAIAGVTKWVSGVSYIEGNDATWSPINYLTYRRKTTGAGTVDPSIDDVNWVPTSAAPGANHDITSLDDITIIGGSVPVTINSTTSSGTKIEMQDAGVIVGFLGGTTSLPFAVFSSASEELLHVDTDGNLVPKVPISVANGGTGSSTGVIPSGTRMIFQQAAAPTGWTKDVSPSMNNASIRLTTGTVGLGGSVPFSTFAAQTIGATTLTSAQIPSHTHGVTDPGHAHIEMGGQAGIGGGSNVVAVDPGTNANTTSSTASATTGISITNTGDGGSHTHALNMDLVYVDFIVATKD